MQVSFAEYRLFYRALLQKRPIIFRSLLFVATPYSKTNKPDQYRDAYTHSHADSLTLSFPHMYTHTHSLSHTQTMMDYLKEHVPDALVDRIAEDPENPDSAPNGTAEILANPPKSEL